MAAAKAQPKAQPAASPAEATGAGAPRFVRLTGSGTYEGGKLLVVGKSLEIGAEISAGLAAARVAAETAEYVLGSAVTAHTLRTLVADVVSRMRAASDQLLAKVEAASDVELVEIAKIGIEPEESDREAADALAAAIEAHAAAIEAEASGTAPLPNAEP